jgi:2'-5' RNA ligase
MGHRYYIGFRLPEALAKDIERIQEELFDPAYAREPLEPHITMLPPPAVERLEPEELVRQIRATAGSFWPMRITLAEVEKFKNTGIAIRVDSEAIHTLQHRLVALLPPKSEVTYFPNPVFSPHVTLAHAHRGKQLPVKLARAYEERFADILPTTFEATELTIFKWIAPRRYTAVSI